MRFLARIRGATSLKRYAVLAVLLFAAAGSGALSQSVTLEGGLGYSETESNTYEAGFRLGVRGVFPVGDALGLYVSPYWFGGVGLDAGVWYGFRVGADDLEGFRSYVGAGLTLVQRQIGLALSAALGYEVARDTEVMLVYTHRPLLRPEFSQAFDISLGLKFSFD